jgi:hypothetical protein
MSESQKNISENEERKPKLDNVSAIFTIIKDLCLYAANSSVDMDKIKKRVFARGFS